MSEQRGIDPSDEQATAEALDGSELGDPDDDYPEDYPPDRALASEEARALTDLGDVPADSLEERIWREEPDQLPPDDGPRVELLEPHPDAGFDPDFADDSLGEVAHDRIYDGSLVADAFEDDEAGRGDQSGEELAIHLVDGLDEGSS